MLKFEDRDWVLFVESNEISAILSKEAEVYIFMKNSSTPIRIYKNTYDEAIETCKNMLKQKEEYDNGK